MKFPKLGMKTNMEPAMSPDAVSGRVKEKKARAFVAPRFAAASPS